MFCVCVCLRVISNQSTSKKSHVSDLSKIDTLLRKTHIKVLRLGMCRSMMSVTKMAYQMWNDHKFSQRNKTTEGEAGVGAGDGKIWKTGTEVVNIGRRLHIKLGEGWLGPLWQLWWYLILHFHYFIFFRNSQHPEKWSVSFKNLFRKYECISCYLPISSNLLKGSFRKT